MIRGILCRVATLDDPSLWFIILGDVAFLVIAALQETRHYNKVRRIICFTSIIGVLIAGLALMGIPPQSKMDCISSYPYPIILLASVVLPALGIPLLALMGGSPLIQAFISRRFQSPLRRIVAALASLFGSFLLVNAFNDIPVPSSVFYLAGGAFVLAVWLVSMFLRPYEPPPSHPSTITLPPETLSKRKPKSKGGGKTTRQATRMKRRPN